MKEVFTAKTSDFKTYCETAFSHYKNGFYADALTNMRKAGEAFCKLIFIFKFNEKIAQNKIGRKNFNELIDSVVKENLVPHSVIHSLTGLQIHGNSAAHDAKVMDAQAHTAIRDLSLLISWLFEEFLNTVIPDSLKKEIEKNTTVYAKSDTAEKLKHELSSLKNENEEREKQLNILLKEKKSNADEKINWLTEELKKSEARIKELEDKKIKLLELELDNTKRQLSMASEKEHTKENKTETINKKQTKFINRKAILLSSLVLIVTAIFLVFKIFFPFTPKNAEVLSASVQYPQPEIYNVVIFPFTILQDNPNIHIKFEEALESRIKQKISEHHLPMRITYNPSFVKSSLSYDEAIEEGRKEKAHLVVFGDLYEPSISDSTQINFKLAVTTKEFPYNDETGIRSFVHLTDSGANKLMREAEFYIEGCMAATYMNKNKFSEALALTYKLTPISRNQIKAYYYILSSCHKGLKNYTTAIRETENFLKLDSTYSYPYFFIADCYAAMGKYKEAFPYYEKAIKIEPNNENYLLNYAALVSADNSKNGMYKAKEIILQTLAYDSACAHAWYMLGNWEYAMKNSKAAKDDFYKCIRYDSTHRQAKEALARVLAFDFDEPEKGEQLLSSVLKKDSADSEALIVLANIYTNTKLKNDKKAEYLYTKSKQYSTSNLYQTELGLGMTAFNQGKIQQAQQHFFKAYSIDSARGELCTYISQTYYLTNQMEKSFPYLMRAYSLDSLNYLNNANLGYYYYSTPNHIDYNKAASYFERVLKTNPYDTLSLQYLATIHFGKGNFQKAIGLFTKLVSFVPDNRAANQYLGLMLEQQEKYVQAIPFIRKTLEYNPNDDYAHYKLAFCMMRVDQNKYLKEATEHAKRAVEINPQGADNLFVLSQIYLLNNDLYKAKEYYKMAVEINPAVANEGVEQAMGLKK